MKKLLALLIVVIVLMGCPSPESPVSNNYPLNDFVGTYASQNDVSTLVINADFTGSLSDVINSENFAWDYISHSTERGVTVGVAFMDSGITISKNYLTDNIKFGDYGTYIKD